MKKVQMNKLKHMSIDYHENNTKAKTSVLVDRKPVVRVVLNKKTGEVLIKVLSGERVLETYKVPEEDVDDFRQKISRA